MFTDEERDWRYEVANGDTVLGLAEWSEHQVEAARRPSGGEKVKYVGETFYCKSPNGTHWLLWGRLLYLRLGRRHQFSVRFRKNARGRFFGFGPRGSTKS